MFIRFLQLETPRLSGIGSIDRLPGYEELERDMPGIDSIVNKVVKTQILGLWNFLKC